jgi:hypothetical protein
MPNDHADRDDRGRVAFYVLLWKRAGQPLELFDDYWRDVHGPICARLPGQYQYWQFHVAHDGDAHDPTGPALDPVAPGDRLEGIAELTFRSVADRQAWFTAAAILMDDEQNIFSKAIGYVTEPGHSKTYRDRIAVGDPNGQPGVLKLHVMVRKADGVGVAEFRRYLTDQFTAAILRSDRVLKVRLHLFEPPDVSRPDAAGVAHSEAPERHYQAAFEIAFRSPPELRAFLASPDWLSAVRDRPRYVKHLGAFRERAAYTFVYGGRMTPAGQRGSRTAQLIASVGASNQLNEDVLDLILGRGVR